MKKIILILVLFPSLAFAAPPTCPVNNVPPAAQGCYTGTGSDDRKIPTGITNPGLLLVYNVDVSAAAPGVYKTPTDPNTGSCLIGNGGVSTCGRANEIQVLTANYFEIGTGSTVNTNGDPYCWFEWATGLYHGTFVYTGDGTSSRDIAIDSGLTPSAALIQLDASGGCFGSGNMYFKTDDMPTDVSYGWFNGGESPRTNVIKGFNTGVVTVGACANENGKIYRGSWWISAPGYGDTVNWTGNGNSGGFGCGIPSDHQVINVGGAPKSVITAGCQGNVSSCGSQGLACVSHTGVFPGIRGINMGTSVSGPGHVSGDDFIAIFSTGSLFDDVIGNLTSTSFTVGSSVSFASNLNDLGILPYAWVTYANAPVVGTVAPADWCFDANTVSCYRSDIDVPGGVDPNEPLTGNNNCSSGSLSGGTSLCGFPGCDCDLTNNNSATGDESNKVIGERSIAYVAASNQSLTCDMATDCNEFNLGQSGASLTYMGHVRTTIDADSTFITKSGSTLHQFEMGFAASGDALVCSVKNTGGTSIDDVGPSTFTTNDFHFGACVFDNGANTIQAYFDGAFTGSPGSIVTDLQGGNGVFGTGYDGTAGDLTGNTNLVVVHAAAVSATDLCRACSCGWTGVGCQCFEPDPTVYVDEGVNDTLCGNCVLPACNKAGPS